MKAKKSLGQNFLIDLNVVNDILKAGKISKEDKILEIGPGRGFLTQFLVEKAQKVLAVEKDSELVDFCQNKFSSSEKLEVLAGDVLKENWEQILTERNFKPFKLIANIPYYITGKIIRLFLENSFRPCLMVLMVQKEVAERICQKPGKMGILSVAVQYFGQPEIMTIVTKDKFDPVPEVDSAILKIKPYSEKEFDFKKEKEFFRLVKIGFSNPRKTLANNLSAGLKIDKKIVIEKLNQLNFKETVRAQELSVEDWRNLLKLNLLKIFEDGNKNTFR
jgi:16S rRNA (adenine1518-N6/adenine1519-N6)-dimethyltransferase